MRPFFSRRTLAAATISSFALVLLAGCTIIRDPQPEQCVVESGRVVGVEEATAHDLVLRLDRQRWFYVNRGLEESFTLDGARAALLDAEVELHVVRGSRHIAQIKRGEDVLFTEFDTP